MTTTQIKATEAEYAYDRNAQTVTAQDGTIIGEVCQSEVTFDRATAGRRYATSRTSSLRWFHNRTRGGQRGSWYETEKAAVEALIASELREGTIHPGPTIRDDDSDDVYTLGSPLTVHVLYAHRRKGRRYLSFDSVASMTLKARSRVAFRWTGSIWSPAPERHGAFPESSGMSSR